MNSSIILEESRLKEAVDYFLTQPAFVFDVEAFGENRSVPHLADLFWISLATKGTCITVPFGHPIGDKIIGETRIQKTYGSKAQKAGQSYWTTIPVYEPAPKQISPGSVFGILEPLFSNPNIIKGGHDVIYDLVSSAPYFGFVPPPRYACTKTGYWILDENQKQLGLKLWNKRHYGIEYDTSNMGAELEKYAFSKAAYYSWCDSKLDWLHLVRVMNELKQQDLMQVFNLEMTLLNVMVGMRMAGAKVDVQRLHELQSVLSEDLIEAEAGIYQAAGKRFNVNSVKQRQTILYGSPPDGQGLRPWKLTKGGIKKRDKGLNIDPIFDYSTDDDTLASYDNPVTHALREYGDTQKLLSTYVNGYLGDDERPCIIYDEHIHAGFQQYGTVTGRFSCRTPNLQNIPRPHTERGKLIRGIFIAEEGSKLVVADYGQIELVVLAHYVGKGALYEGFMQGIDPHTMTAAMVLGKDPIICHCIGECTKNHVTKVERQDLGKTLGFAVVFGAGVNKVASMAKVTVPRAKEILARHAEMFPEIHEFKQSVLDLSRTRTPVPYIKTLLGHRRRIPEMNSPVKGIRLSAERQMFNALLQGGAADLTKMAMIRLDSLLPSEATLTLTVHDELVVSSPNHLAENSAAALVEAMTGEGIQKLVRVPLLADVKIVDRWSDAK